MYITMRVVEEDVYVFNRFDHLSDLDTGTSMDFMESLPQTKKKKEDQGNLAERKQSESHVLLIPGFKCYRHWDFRGLCGIFTPNREVKMTKASWKKGKSQESMSSRSSCSSQS